MKRLLILLAAALTLFTSCGKGYSRLDEDIFWDIVPVKIYSNDWEQRDNYLMVKVSVPELTKYICTDGMVQCYLEFYDGTQALLPSTRYCSIDLEDPETGVITPYLYQRLLDYEFGPGYVYVYYTINDFCYEDDWPEDMTLRVVMQH